MLSALRNGRVDHALLAAQAMQYELRHGPLPAYKPPNSVGLHPTSIAHDDAPQAAGPTASEFPQQLRILSLNTWMSFMIGGSNRMQRMDLMLDHIRTFQHGPDTDTEHQPRPTGHILQCPYDVIVLQELFTLGAGTQRGVQSRHAVRMTRAMTDLGFQNDPRKLG